MYEAVTRALVPGCMALFLMLWVSPLNAKVIDLSGTWKLNLEKSDGGKRPTWKQAIFKVVHKEPALKYSFTGTDAEGKPFNSEFDGAIDGKPYKETGPQGRPTTTLKRINDFTIEGTQILPDGKTTVTFTDVVSKDGKVGTFKMTVKGPEGEYKQLTVYEKQ
jgi:hypothetical protein